MLNILHLVIFQEILCAKIIRKPIWDIWLEVELISLSLFSGKSIKLINQKSRIRPQIQPLKLIKVNLVLIYIKLLKRELSTNFLVSIKNRANVEKVLIYLF